MNIMLKNQDSNIINTLSFQVSYLLLNFSLTVRGEFLADFVKEYFTYLDKFNFKRSLI